MLPYTRVKISFFKPTGYERTFYVRTTHRGSAIQAVLDASSETERSCVNYIKAEYARLPDPYTDNILEVR